MTTHGSWLKTREIYPLSIPEARSPKQRCQQARLPPKAPGESLLQPLPVSGGWPAFLGSGTRHSNLCLCHHGTASLHERVGVEISLFS